MPKGDTALLFWILKENILLLKTQTMKGELSAHLQCWMVVFFFFFLVHTFTEGIILWGSQPHRGFRLSSLYYTGPINALLSSYNVPHWALKPKTNSYQNQPLLSPVTCKVISKVSSFAYPLAFIYPLVFTPKGFSLFWD